MEAARLAPVKFIKVKMDSISTTQMKECGEKPTILHKIVHTQIIMLSSIKMEVEKCSWLWWHSERKLSCSPIKHLDSLLTSLEQIFHMIVSKVSQVDQMYSWSTQIRKLIQSTQLPINFNESAYILFLAIY